MKAFFVCAVLAGIMVAGCSTDSSSDLTAEQSSTEPEFSEMEVGASFAEGYETRKEPESKLPDFAWTDTTATGKAVLDYCHDLGVTTVAAADDAFLGALDDLYYAGVLRKFGQAKYETLLRFDETMSRTANDGTDGKDRLAARIKASGEFDSEVRKAETYCTE
jgi:hypothetical protein